MATNKKCIAFLALTYQKRWLQKDTDLDSWDQKCLDFFHTHSILRKFHILLFSHLHVKKDDFKKILSKIAEIKYELIFFHTHAILRKFGVLSWHFLLCRSPISHFYDTPFQSQSISIFEFPIIIFSPFLMGGLLLLKVILPFFVVALFAFSVQHVTQMPQKALFLMLLVLSDIMGLRFFFLVTDQGSWLDIGTSLSHFVIVEGTVIFLQVLFQLASFSMKLSFSKSQHITTNESSFDVHAEWNIDMYYSFRSKR